MAAERPGNPGRLSRADRVLLRTFETGSLPAEGFHHRDHVQMAWLHVRRYGLLEALDRFSKSLRRLARQAGQPGRYHETMTRAFMLLINERIERDEGDISWEEFARRNPDLLAWGPSVLEAYYDASVLGSDLARRVFVLPPGGGPV